MGPPTSPLSMPVWFGGRRRDFIAGGYIFKMLSMAMICILLGYSVSRLITAPEIPQYTAPVVDSLTKTRPSNNDGSSPDKLDVALPYSHESDPPPTLYRPPELPGQEVGKGQGSLYDKFADRLKHFNPWRPAELKESPKSQSDDAVGASEDDLHKEQPGETEQQTSLNKTGSYEKILEYNDVTVDSPPLIGKVTIIYGDERPVYDRAVRTHEFHNRLHGYPMHVLRQSILSDVWSKPAYILSVMLREMAKPRNRRLKWIFWSDADTIITNPMVPLEIFLPPSGFDDVDLLVTRDWNGLNNGVFLMRINERTINLFCRVVTYPYFRPQEQLVFRDQSAMAKLLETPEIKTHVMYVPQRWFNAYQGEIDETIGPHQIRHGDFLIHFAGVTNRDERMGHWLQRAELHSDEWEVQLKFTSYPREIEEFWEEQRKERTEGKKAVEELRDTARKFYEMSKLDAERYKDKFSGEEWRRMQEVFGKFRATFDNKNQGYDLEILMKAFETLQASLGLLRQTSEQANRILLKETHDVLFSAEKLMLDEEDSGQFSLEIKEIDAWIQTVKQDILQTPLNAEKTEKDATQLRNKYELLNKKVEEMQYEKQKQEEQLRQQLQEEEQKLQQDEAQRLQQEEEQKLQQESQNVNNADTPAGGEVEAITDGMAVVETQKETGEDEAQPDMQFHQIDPNSNQ